MRTINAGDGDITFKMVDELTSVMQRVEQRIQFWRGEWDSDASKGVPYLEDVLGYNYDTALAQQVIIDQIRSVDGVTDVKDVSTKFIHKTRILEYHATVVTEYGASTIDSELEA